MFKFEFSAARCGAGKTRAALRRVAGETRRWVYATDRRAVMKDRSDQIEAFASEFGTKPQTKIVCSDSDDDDMGTRRRIKVRQEIEKQRRLLGDLDHAILIVTHEALKTADLSDFTGWSLIIDETPTVFDSATRKTPASEHWFAANFGLEDEPALRGWRRVVALPGCVSVPEVASDVVMRAWHGFRKRIETGSVYVNLASWEEMRSGKQWTWWSVWKPQALEAFDGVTIVANAFEESIAYKLMVREGVTFCLWSIEDIRQWKPRNLLIRYFADTHTGGTGWWRGDEGKPCLAAAARWIAENSDPANHIWTCNKDVEKAMKGIPGVKLTPRQHGSNEFKGLTCASIIYSAKIQKHERAILPDLGVSADDVRRSRELEDILQFACRLSLRDPDNDTYVEVRVYDREQAEFLKRYFDDHAEHVRAEIEWVELDELAGITRPVRQNAPKRSATEAEQRERKRMNSREWRRREAEKAGRPLRDGRGRPPKQEGVRM